MGNYTLWFLIVVVSVFVILLVLKILLTAKKKAETEITKQYSVRYNSILALNNKYDYYKIDNGGFFKFSIGLRSKRELEKFDLGAYVATMVIQKNKYYNALIERAHINSMKYKQYCSSINMLSKSTSLEEYNKFGKIKVGYKKFLEYEKSICKEAIKNKPTTIIRFSCHATYTSPSGRNHYYRDMDFTDQQIMNLIDSVLQKQKYELDLKAKKEEAEKKKREKERKLRELEKIEKDLNKKAEEIENREKEFNEATKGNIYSAGKAQIENIELGITDEMTISQKLKILKTQFESGEISYKEYQERRRELI